MTIAKQTHKKSDEKENNNGAHETTDHSNDEHEIEHETHDEHGTPKKHMSKEERRLIGYISASRYLFNLTSLLSRRTGRTPEKKRESAEKASEINERLHGTTLSINKNGEVAR